MAGNNKEKRHRLLAVLLLVSGYLLLILPMMADALSRFGQETKISAYSAHTERLSDAQMKEAIEKSALYNAEIAEQQKRNPFTYQGEAASDERYSSLPVQGDIGILEISSIDVYLPVGHGTQAALLQTQAGHLYGTSLPTGGPDTHAVIAGHTALRTAELFTRISELEPGDLFYFYVLNEVHVYTVKKIRTVLPEEADAFLQVQKGKDLITLYTCTPYGINSHRLLVTGERCVSLEQTGNIQNREISVGENRKRACATLLFLLGIPVVSVIVVCIFRRQKRKWKNPSMKS